MEMTLGEIAALVGGEIHGDEATIITGVNGVREAQPGEITFVRDKRFVAMLQDSKASAVLMDHLPENQSMAVILVERPEIAFGRILHEVATFETFHPQGIHPMAAVDDDVVLGEGCALDAHVRVVSGARLGKGVIAYAGVYIGRNCEIGDNTILYPNVTIREGTELGARCIVHANTAIGSDGFGFVPIDKKWIKVPQVGRVIIGDDVEIGSNTAIDRATFGITRIGNGTKIDNLVQVGHNVEIGEHCVIAGKAGLAGSARVGNHVQIGAEAGIKGHIEVGDGAIIAARGGATKSVAPGAILSGFPAIEHSEERRIIAARLRTPELIRRVRALERRLEALEKDAHEQ